MTALSQPQSFSQRVKTYLKTNPRLKAWIHWTLFPTHDFRPRWWVRAFVNPFVHKRGRGSIVRWSARLDVLPYNRFDLGAYSIVESHAVVNNGVGDVVVGEHSLIGMCNSILGPVTIGNRVLLAQHVVLSGLNHAYEDVSLPIAQQPTTTRPIVVEEGAWVGANAVVTAGVRIGRNAVVAAGSVVTRDVPPFSVVGGNPARLLKRYNFDTQQWERVEAVR